MAGTLARAGNCVFSFPSVNKHKEVNNRWSITWSYTGQHRLQRTPESEKGIIWRGEQLGDFSERLRKKAKNTGMSNLLCKKQLKTLGLWKETKMGR